MVIKMGFVHAPTLMFYRRLLKTMMKTFTGDYNMFHQTRIEARRKIREHADLRDPVEIQEKIFFGEEVRDFLEVNVMQGNLQENGNYRFKARSEHGVGSGIKDGSIK
jgi:complex III assembly factor LYRM7